jgi:hypothetical protein
MLVAIWLSDVSSDPGRTKRFENGSRQTGRPPRDPQCRASEWRIRRRRGAPVICRSPSKTRRREEATCKHLVAGGVAEQVVDLLEPVEIEAEHGETRLPGVRLAISWSTRALKWLRFGNRGQRVVMRQEMDMLLGVLARLQIANRDDAVRTPGKHDRPQDQFDRRHRAVAVTQFRLNRLVGPRQQLGAGDRSRESNFRVFCRRGCRPGQAGQIAKSFC